MYEQLVKWRAMANKRSKTELCAFALHEAIDAIEKLSAEVREAFSQGFWVGCDAPAALPKGYVDEAFERRNEKPVTETVSGREES